MSNSPGFPTLADELRLDSQNPWPGLTAFTERQQDYFFGRREESGELFHCVKRERLTVLFGKSGLGKTSLLQAGLFPQLRTASLLPVYIRLSYADGAPALESQVRAALEAAIGSAELAEVAPPQPGETVWGYLHKRGGNLINYEGGIVTPVLVFDQFEEWFTLGARKEFAMRLSEDFLPAFSDLIENRTPQALTEKLTKDRNLARQYDLEASGCRILITLREDYLANLENLRAPMPSLVFLDNRIRLTEMNGRQAYSVVAKPNPDLVAGDVAEFIVRFVAGVHADAMEGNGQLGAPLPLEQLEIAPAILSLFCRQLNEKRLKQNLPRVTRELVAAQGITIIDDFYKQSIADMRPAVRRLIEDRLLTKAGYRDNIDLAQAKADLEQAGVRSSCIDDLVRLRLLQVEEHRGVPRLELTHDVLADPVKRSRDQWDEQQARERRLEQERETLAEAKRAENEALRRARFLQKVIGAVVLVSLLLAILLVYARHERSEAQRKEANAEKATNEAEKAKKDAEKAKNEAEKAKNEAEKAETRARDAGVQEAIMLQLDEADKKKLETNKKKLETTSKEFLDLCDKGSRTYHDMVGDEESPAVRNLFLHFYEHSLMGANQCFSVAQKVHGIAPQNIDVTDALSLIPLRAAESARQRRDYETVSAYCDEALKLSESLQKEQERHGVKILVARTYFVAAYELAKAGRASAQQTADRGMILVADLRKHSAPNDFDDRDWDRLGTADLYHAFYLEAVKKDTDAIKWYEESFRDEVNAHNRKPSEKQYVIEARNQAFGIGDHEKQLGNNDGMIQWYERAHKLSDQYINALLKEPQVIQRDRDLVTAYGDAAEKEERRDRWDEAVDYRGHAVAILAALKTNAYNEVRNDLAIAYSDLSGAEIHAGQIEKGLADDQKCIAVAEEIKDRATLSSICSNGVKAFVAQQRYNDARKLSDQHIQMLLKWQPQDTGRDRCLQAAYRNAVTIDDGVQDWAGAVEDYKRQIAILTALNNKHAYDKVQNDLASAYGGLSWSEIEAGRFTEGLEDAKRGLALDSTETWIIVNQAHGLLLSGNGREARALYLKIKDYPRGNRTLADDIGGDFRQLCRLGYVRPEMIDIVHDLGLNDLELVKCLAGATNTK